MVSGRGLPSGRDEGLVFAFSGKARELSDKSWLGYTECVCGGVALLIGKRVGAFRNVGVDLSQACVIILSVIFPVVGVIC